MDNNLLDTEGYRYALNKMGIKFSSESDMFDKVQAYVGYSLAAILLSGLVFLGTFLIKNFGNWMFLAENIKVLIALTLTATKLISFVTKKNKFSHLMRVVKRLRSDGKDLSQTPHFSLDSIF